MSQRVFFKNLDALRFFAAFIVLSYHISIWLPLPDNDLGKCVRIILSLDGSAGETGVKFFFVLSGFLITYLMFEEQNSNKGFSVSQFYLRRILRIWPLYYFTLLLGFVFYPLVINQFPFNEQVSPLLYSLFAANINNMSAKPQTGILGVQWSVSVEEQFYLMWPIFFVMSGRGLKFIWVIAALFLVSIIFIALHGHPYHLLSCIRELSLGAFAAWFCFFHLQKVKDLLLHISMRTTIFVYVVGICLIAAGFQIHKRFPQLEHFLFILTSLFFVFVLLEQVYSKNSFYKAGNFKWCTYMGKRSYSIYLLHMVAISIALIISKNLFIQLAVTLIATYLFSEVSYRIIERPFLRLKARYF